MTNSAPTSVFVILPHPEPLIWLQLFSTAVYLHCKGLAQEQPCAQFPHVLGEKLSRHQVQNNTGQSQHSLPVQEASF